MDRTRIEIGLLALLHSLQHVYLNALPPLYLLLRSDFNVSTLQIGLIGSVSGGISILQGPACYLVERIGGKRLAVLSMIGCSAAVFSYSLAPSFEVLLILSAMFSLAQVTFHPATYAMVVNRAAASHRGKYIAYHQVGGVYWFRCWNCRDCWACCNSRLAYYVTNNSCHRTRHNRDFLEICYLSKWFATAIE